MGKSQEEEPVRPVKRQVVSASATLEVVSEESFARRLQGMNACLNCQKERSAVLAGGSSSAHGSGVRQGGQQQQHQQQQHHSHHRSGRGSKQGRRKQAKSNTPIVIHLKDTLRSALQQRQRSFDTDSDVSARSTDDDAAALVTAQDVAAVGFGDVSSIPEFVPQRQAALQQRILPQGWPQHHSHSPSFLSSSHHHQHQRRREKSKKNLTALISVIEKAHQKDSHNHANNCNMAFNLSQNSMCSKLSHLLNNAVTWPDKGRGHPHPHHARSIVECDNVDVICNDLYEKGVSGEAVEDSDSQSDKSSITSSSEALSDSDSLVVEESAGSEFTAEELQRLAEYTTGFPLYRYDCAPSECPECLSAWYTHQIYQYEGCYLDTLYPPKAARQEGVSSKNTNRKQATANNDSDLNVTLQEGGDCEVGVAPCVADRAGSEDRASEEGKTGTSCVSVAAVCSSSSPITSSGSDGKECGGWPCSSSKGAARRQLWDIDVSQAGRRSGSGGGARDQRENPFADSVYLDLTGSDVSISVYYHHSLLQDEVARATAVLSSPAFCAATAAAPLYAACYSPFAGGAVYSLPMPLTLFSEAALPRIAMVPPHELKKFTTTAPPQRQWIVASHPDRTRPSAIFSVMCYNVLCDKYCTRQQYGYCPVWALNWEYRKKGIMDDIRGLNGDIISLQEVETDQFYNFFLPELKRDGYDGIFSPKSRARTMTEQERKHVDGCAIFFKKAKFSLLEEKLVEFNQLAMANAAGSDDMLNRVMTKDNIGLAALLETKPPIFENGMPPEPHTRQLLLVSTAHIHWDPEFSDVKLVQTMMLMWELQHFVEEATRKYTLPFPGPYDCNSVPFLFCGDLNSLPDSGVIEFLTNGRVAVNHEDFKDNEYDHCMKKMSNGDKDHIYHNFRLARAYNDIMPATNFTYDFKGIIDYIFYSRDHLNVLGMLGPYDEEWFRQNKILGCPHPHIPSDHFSLFVEMEMPVRLPPPGRGPPLPPVPKPR